MPPNVDEQRNKFVSSEEKLRRYTLLDRKGGLASEFFNPSFSKTHNNKDQTESFSV